MHDEEHALVGVEMLHCPPDEVSFCNRVRGARLLWPGGDTWVEFRRIPDIDLPKPYDAPVTERHPTGVDDDAIEPRVEVGWVTERREVPPGRDERLLDSVPGVHLGAEDRHRQPVQVIDAHPRQVIEGGRVSMLGEADQARFQVRCRQWVDRRSGQGGSPACDLAAREYLDVLSLRHVPTDLLTFYP
jgi:hypothetical protein